MKEDIKGLTALQQLDRIVRTQQQVRVTKLEPILASLLAEMTQGTALEESLAELSRLKAEIDRKEGVITKLIEASQQHTLVRTRHKTAMQDYENLKRAHGRLKEEHTNLLANRSKGKIRLNEIQRELTDHQVKVVRYEKKLRKAGLLDEVPQM